MTDTRQGLRRIRRPGAPEDTVLVKETRPSGDFGEPDEVFELQMPESMYRFYRIEPSLDALPIDG